MEVAQIVWDHQVLLQKVYLKFPSNFYLQKMLTFMGSMKLSTYQDDSNEFEMEDGKCLTGDEQVGHLRSSNRVLADKAGMYQGKF